MRPWRTCRPPVMIVAGCLLSVTSAFGQSPEKTDSLTALNLEFRAAYARARADALATVGPIVLFDGEKLTLIRGDRRESGTELPARYHHIKAVSHLPFAVYLEFRGAGDGELTADLRTRLTKLRE